MSKDEIASYEVAELMCVCCRRRWIGVYMTETLLKNLMCPECLTPGGVIKTGQTLEGYVGKEVKNMEAKKC